ncbi:polysaccharide biosynthesis tyrosine autokinase [Patulibacter sp. NPDC049589]|uniref:polysaccharide biosynthesis tyrosine autokinase n=1 Tax=Patulibacter sp. NPDC049589 TaxID=3154731 RepID=UPI003427E9FF
MIPNAFRAIAWRRYLTVGLLGAVIAAAAAFVVSSAQTKKYTANADLLFRDPQLDQKLFGSSFFAPNRDAVREAATNLELAGAPVVAEKTAAALGGGISRQDVQDAINVKPDGPSDLIRVEATLPSPRDAQRFTNVYAQTFLRYRQQSDQSKVDAARQLVQAQIDRLDPAARASSRGQGLEARSQQLEILASLQTGNVEIAQSADLPTDPSSPRTKQNVAIGFVLGFLIGAFIAWLALKVDRRLRTIEDVDSLHDGPVLGAIPASADYGKTTSPTVIKEPFRLLLTRLRYFNVDRKVQTVLVTSAAVGEGKSTISLELATVAAEQHRRVLLLETDLRRPSLGTKLEVPPGAGLVDSIVTDRPWRDAVTKVPTSVDDIQLDVLLAGQIPPNPGEILASQAFAAILKDAKNDYDLIVMDTPPLLVVADAFPLVEQSDGTIVVVRLDQTDRAQAINLLEDITRVGGTILGTVANGTPAVANAYYYTEL